MGDSNNSGKRSYGVPIAVVVTIVLALVGFMVNAQMQRDSRQEMRIVDLQKEKVDNETLKQLIKGMEKQWDRTYDELKEIQQRIRDRRNDNRRDSRRPEPSDDRDPGQ